LGGLDHVALHGVAVIDPSTPQCRNAAPLLLEYLPRDLLIDSYEAVSKLLEESGVPSNPGVVSASTNPVMMVSSLARVGLDGPEADRPVDALQVIEIQRHRPWSAADLDDLDDLQRRIWTTASDFIAGD
jgi:hypothetical protein